MVEYLGHTLTRGQLAPFGLVHGRRIEDAGNSSDSVKNALRDYACIHSNCQRLCWNGCVCSEWITAIESGRLELTSGSFSSLSRSYSR